MNMYKTLHGGWMAVAQPPAEPTSAPPQQVESRRQPLGGFAAVPTPAPASSVEPAQDSPRTPPAVTVPVVSHVSGRSIGVDPSVYTMPRAFPEPTAPGPLSAEELVALRPPVPVAALLASATFALGAFVCASAIAIAIVR